MKDVAFTPDWVSNPWGTVKEILEEQGLPFSTLGAILKTPEDNVQDLLDRPQTVSLWQLELLAYVFGPSFQFWVNRFHTYSQGIRAGLMDTERLVYRSEKEDEE